MAVIYQSAEDAIEAALAMSFAGHPYMSPQQIDRDRMIVKETMIVCKDGMGTRHTTVYRDISGRYVGHADYCHH